jgi:hypothetical protein
MNQILVRDLSGRIWRCGYGVRQEIDYNAIAAGGGPVGNLRIHQAALLGKLQTNPKGMVDGDGWIFGGTVYSWFNENMDDWGRELPDWSPSGGTPVTAVHLDPQGIAQVTQIVNPSVPHE